MDTPGLALWGVPVSISIFLTCAGVNGLPRLAMAAPCRLATEAVTIGEALDVPEKRKV